MIDSGDLKPGVNIRIGDEYFTVVWSQHHKPGKGGAVMRTKLKNIKSGGIIERTFKIGEKFEEVNFEKVPKQYLYSDGKECHFMDLETYEEVSIDKKSIGDALKFLKEGEEVKAIYVEKEFLGIELPRTVELKVIRTVPGIRGDTVSNVMKPATLETGAEILVPLFIKENDIVKVDTTTGEYLERLERK